MFRVALALALAAILAGAGSASASTQAPSFARSDHQQLGNNHVLADLNGDGRLDIAGIGAQSAAVLLSTGPGTFGPRVEYPLFTWAQDLAAGDFDGDGDQDLVVTINDPGVGLALLIGRGDGTFAAPVNFPNTSGFDSPAVVAADMTNDGMLDVVIAHQIACYTAPCIVANTISVMVGNGDGTFQPTREIDVGRGMSRIAVGDFNRDARNDLAIAGDSSRLYRLYGNGDGTFVQQPTLTMTADTFAVDATDVDVADFNRDAIADLVVAVALNGSRTAILIGNADGTFRAPLILTEPNLRVPQYQAVADYNGDGFQDLAITLGDGTQGLMQIRNGNGDGTFQAPVYMLVPAPKSSIGGFAIVAGNLNGDAQGGPRAGDRRRRPGARGPQQHDGRGAPGDARGAGARQPRLGRDARAARRAGLGGRQRRGVLPHPDRRLERLLGADRRRPDGDGLAVHRPRARRAPALVARARRQLGRNARRVVGGAQLHAARGHRARRARGAVGEPRERHRRRVVAGDGHADRGGAGGRAHRCAVEQQRGGDAAGERDGGGGSDGRDVRDRDDHGHDLDRRDDHRNCGNADANGGADRVPTGAGGDADGHGQRAQR